MQGLTTAAGAVSSPRWAPFCGRSGAAGARARAPRTRRPPSPAHGQGHGGCGRPLDRVAGWVGGGIAAAFFASLERCSCVNVRTQHDELDDELRDSEAPLIMFEVDGSGNAVAVAGHGAGAGGRRSGRGSWKSGTGKKSGGCGMGCYGD